jgi:hypothetical protein
LPIYRVDIAAAVAEAVLHDYRENQSGLNGFPEVVADRPQPGRVAIALRRDRLKQSFEMSEEDAESAVRLMKKGQRCAQLLERVQKSLADLEFRYISRSR